MIILVTGKQGQVARSLVEQGKAAGVEIITLGRPEFDLADPSAMAGAIVGKRPDIIVSAAAFNDVDAAQEAPARTMALNAIAPVALAKAANTLDVPLIHMSTDYVFDGKKTSPYNESDIARPLNVYGAAKLAAEAAIAAETANHVILRTGWVYSPFGSNFVKTMLRLAASRPQVLVVGDQRGTPTSALDIAVAIIEIAKNLAGDPTNARLRGIFHLAGNGAASWAEFATEIFAISTSLGGACAQVTPITAAQFGASAPRPENSCLSTNKLTDQHDISLPHWRQSTRQTIARLLGVPDSGQASVSTPSAQPDFAGSAR
ncbi:MAG: dTDP-4-dehydrorhamnose reductase [Alphaproteobacteria bacterium]